MARICREARARVKENQLLRDLCVVAPAMTSAGLRSSPSAFHSGGGMQVAIDTTVVSALTGRGVARGRRQGQAIHQAEDKRRRYTELLSETRSHFLVMAFEVAGRWSPSAVTFLRNFLAWHESLSCPGSFAVQPNSCSSSVGQLCWLAPSSERTLPAFWGSLWVRALV